MWAFLSSKFIGYLGAFTLIMVLLIVLTSIMGGLSYHYDTSDSSWGGWTFTININPGQALENIQERIEGRKEDKKEREPLLELKPKEPNERTPILPIRPGDPGIGKLPRTK